MSDKSKAAGRSDLLKEGERKRVAAHAGCCAVAKVSQHLLWKVPCSSVGCSGSPAGAMRWSIPSSGEGFPLTILQVDWERSSETEGHRESESGEQTGASWALAPLVSGGGRQRTGVQQEKPTVL